MIRRGANSKLRKESLEMNRANPLGQLRKFGVGDGNRTRNIRSHSPVLCRLSYSHQDLKIISTDSIAR
jgi:hypothetical protein